MIWGFKMLTTHRTIGKLAIVLFGILFVVVIGCKAAKFADDYAVNSQNRIDAAFAVLDK